MFEIGKAKFVVLEKEIAFEGKPIGSEISIIGKLTTYKVTTFDLFI
jgi:hypothetical protein